MKRSASPIKICPESKISAGFLDKASEQCPLDIVRHGVDQARCILGHFYMIWRKENRIEGIASVHSSSQEVHRFQIHFNTSEDSLTSLSLVPQDEFRLSLHGAEVEKLPQIPKLSTLPLKLVYKNGVHIEWKSRGSEHVRMVNTWPLDEANTPDENSWYGTPSAVPLQFKRKQDEAPPHEEVRPRQDKEDRKRRRLEAKRQKSKAMVAEPNMEVSEPKAPPAAVSCQNDAPQVLGDVSSSSVNISTTRPHEERPPRISGAILDSKLELEADLRWEGEVYRTLKEIQFGQIVHLVGIVTAISEPLRTRNGDWMRFIDIIDPSNYGSTGLKINCFTKKYKEWLPHPVWGHVVILRNVKVALFNNILTGIGYSDKLGWAAYSPSKDAIYHGQLNGVPRQEGLADGGYGVAFSPFYQPKEGEVQYCMKLSDWWQEVQKTEQSESMKHTVDPVHNSLRRVHRLISDAGPSIPPDGYFDCTVEVLKSFSNFNGVYTLYVTDYTHNGQMRSVQSNWCPNSLSDYVLQMEMWDDAAAIAQTMREGNYYLIKNARMRNNSAGYLEGKVAQSKIIQLKEEDGQRNSHLQTLLERKKVWLAKQEAKPDTDIAHQLIQNAEDSKFFHCTVELVHAALSTSDIYVTDYTSHCRLGIIDEPWSKGLENCLARIRLSEEQSHIAESAVTGSFYSIKKLRLKYSPTEECFRGFLGGTERLIQVLNPNKTDNEHLNGLLRRREVWQQKMIQLQQAPNASPIRPSLTTSRQPYTRIKDIDHGDTDIRKYQIFARAIDFYPLKLEDAFYQFCKRCKVEIPKSKQACFNCSDFEHQYLQYLYQLYVMTEDEDGKQIIISINDECPLLKGLERVYLPDNVAALRNFRERLNPLLGNLTIVHSALLSEKKIEINSPFGVYEVDSWLVSEGKRAFCLVQYDQAVVTKS